MSVFTKSFSLSLLEWVQLVTYMHCNMAGTRWGSKPLCHSIKGRYSWDKDALHNCFLKVSIWMSRGWQGREVGAVVHAAPCLRSWSVLKSGHPPGSRHILYLYGEAASRVTYVFPFQEYKSKAPKQTSAASFLLEDRSSLFFFFF